MLNGRAPTCPLAPFLPTPRGGLAVAFGSSYFCFCFPFPKKKSCKSPVGLVQLRNAWESKGIAWVELNKDWLQIPYFIYFNFMILACYRSLIANRFHPDWNPCDYRLYQTVLPAKWSNSITSTLCSNQVSLEASERVEVGISFVFREWKRFVFLQEYIYKMLL